MGLKLIIAGTRTITNYALLEKAMIASKFAEEEIEEVVSGGAAGVDTLGEQWAKKHGIKVKRFPANWDRDGKAAGPIRNKAMAVYAHKDGDGALLALWDGKSPGTSHMIFLARGMGLRGKIYKIKKGE